jgi:DNA helicase-2/ATP-dependent DNA helicase PcrA
VGPRRLAPELPLRARRQKVPVPNDDIDRDWIADTVGEVADGISSQGFEPTPSYAACSICDYRIVCPAAER